MLCAYFAPVPIQKLTLGSQYLHPLLSHFSWLGASETEIFCWISWKSFSFVVWWSMKQVNSPYNTELECWSVTYEINATPGVLLYTVVLQFSTRQCVPDIIEAITLCSVIKILITFCSQTNYEFFNKTREDRPHSQHNTTTKKNEGNTHDYRIIDNVFFLTDWTKSEWTK